jgi:hypothetical protein
VWIQHAHEKVWIFGIKVQIVYNVRETQVLSSRETVTHETKLIEPFAAYLVSREDKLHGNGVWQLLWQPEEPSCSGDQRTLHLGNSKPALLTWSQQRKQKRSKSEYDELVPSQVG